MDLISYTPRVIGKTMEKWEKMDKQQILVVDDEPRNIDVLMRCLENEGFSLWAAKDCEAALTSASKDLPDLILLDVIMPGIDGFETCRRLKKIKNMDDVPIIFITAMMDKESKIKGFEVGGVDYIVKPIQPPELLARVNTHLSIRSLRQQLERQIMQLQEQNKRFQDLEKAAFDGICIREKETILEVNDTLTGMFGYLHKEMTGQNILEFTASKDRDEVKQKLIEGDNKAHVVEGLKKDGSLFPLEVRGKDAVWQGRNVRVGVIRDLSRLRKLEEENRVLHLSLNGQDRLGRLEGKSPIMHRIYERIVQVAGSRDSIVIYGETGTGKELAAKTIFELSTSYNRRFVAVNCSAVQEPLFEAQFFGFRKGAFSGAENDTIGFFECAKEGTLFLDEVGELTPSMQAKLLRVLQDDEYIPLGTAEKRIADVRIISASNRELRNLVQDNLMREDFFQRIHVIALEMPPLRTHMEDIPLLVDHFLRQRTITGESKLSIPATLMDRFMEHDWPGNVRELFNELRRYLATGEVELNSELPKNRVQSVISKGQTYNELMEDFECRVLTEALSLHSGNRAQMAESFGIPRKTLYRKIKKYNL
ncbi:MAG: response regulator [Bacteroidetes bacterium]|nr:response regulator [Bacteroidota bacterium]